MVKGHNGEIMAVGKMEVKSGLSLAKISSVPEIV